MIFINDVRYIKVWDVDIKEKYIDVRSGTSDKKQDGTYENSSWNVRLVGKAVEQGKHLKKGDTYTIVKGKISNVYVKAKETTYLNVIAFEIDFEQSMQQQTKNEFDTSKQEDFNGFQAIDGDDDIPF